MFRITLRLTEGELLALGYCMGVGYDRAMTEKETEMKKLISELHRKILCSDKEPLSEDQQ